MRNNKIEIYIKTIGRWLKKNWNENYGNKILHYNIDIKLWPVIRSVYNTQDQRTLYASIRWSERIMLAWKLFRHWKCLLLENRDTWVRKFPEIFFGIFPEIAGKIAVLFRKNSAEKFRKNFGNYFIKHRKKSQFFDSSDVQSIMHTHTYRVMDGSGSPFKVATCKLAICIEAINSIFAILRFCLSPSIAVFVAAINRLLRLYRIDAWCRLWKQWTLWTKILNLWMRKNLLFQ